VSSIEAGSSTDDSTQQHARAELQLTVDRRTQITSGVSNSDTSGQNIDQAQVVD